MGLNLLYYNVSSFSPYVDDGVEHAAFEHLPAAEEENGAADGLEG